MRHSGRRSLLKLTPHTRPSSPTFVPQFGLASRRPSSVLPVLSRGTRRMRQVSPVVPSSLTRTVASISSISPLRRIYSLARSSLSPSLDSELIYIISATRDQRDGTASTPCPTPSGGGRSRPYSLALVLVVPPRTGLRFPPEAATHSAPLLPYVSANAPVVVPPPWAPI